MNMNRNFFACLLGAAIFLPACNNPYTASRQYPAHAYNNAHNRAYLPAYGNTRQLRSAINVNYETLSTFEEPLAMEVGNATLLLRGRMDVPIQYSIERNENLNRRVIGNHQISAETQLPNRITVGAVYGGRFENISGSTNDYSDKIAGYAGGSWGTVFGGNVSNLVYEDVRRKRGVSQIGLAGDGALGQLDEWSGGYRGRYGPVIISAAVDENADYDVGISFQRPIGSADYRFAAHHNTGTHLAADNNTKLETKSVNLIGEYVYGSSRFDVGGGYEQISDADRWYGSAGMATKHGAWSLSAEGHYGEIEGQKEVSAVIGVKRDIARGLAATIAVDYQDRQININNVDYLNTKDTRMTMALHYGF